MLSRPFPYTVPILTASLALSLPFDFVSIRSFVRWLTPSFTPLLHCSILTFPPVIIEHHRSPNSTVPYRAIGHLGGIPTHGCLSLPSIQQLGNFMFHRHSSEPTTHSVATPLSNYNYAIVTATRERKRERNPHFFTHDRFISIKPKNAPVSWSTQWVQGVGRWFLTSHQCIHSTLELSLYTHSHFRPIPCVIMTDKLTSPKESCDHSATAAAASSLTNNCVNQPSSSSAPPPRGVLIDIEDIRYVYIVSRIMGTNFEHLKASCFFDLSNLILIRLKFCCLLSEWWSSPTSSSRSLFVSLSSSLRAG